MKKEDKLQTSDSLPRKSTRDHLHYMIKCFNKIRAWKWFIIPVIIEYPITNVVLIASSHKEAFEKAQGIVDLQNKQIIAIEECMLPNQSHEAEKDLQLQRAVQMAYCIYSGQGSV